MNCISDFVCDYHSKYGLIESVNIISINNDDCALNIFSNKSLIRTSIVNVKILSRPHEKLYEIEKLDVKQNLILTIDNYSCMVKAIKIHDQSVEVMSTSDLLLNNESTKLVSIEHLSICGTYESFDSLKSISIPMPCEYSRYFNNINIFKPLLSHTNNTMIHWNAEELKLKVLAFDDASLKKIEFLMPVFISQLSLLSCGKHFKSIDVLSSYMVWEYQYENEEEANYAIGPKGSHILAVRNFRGIAGVVLTKSNRLRIIAENKFALKEARSLLEIKRESYMFDDSFIPILIGKNASRITELVNKAGLHCIHVPNCAWNGVVNEHVTVNDPSMQGKRELLLFGTHESINSAKLLLEMEESVKDLKKEFELRKNSKLRQSLSLKSSTSSISKESEKQPSWDKMPEEVFEDPLSYPFGGKFDGQNLPPLAWADMQDDSGDDTKCSETVTNTVGKEGYTDFFSSQTNAARDRRSKKNHNWNQQKPHSPETRNNYRQKRINRKLPKQQFPPGGLLFTNSALSQGILNDDEEQFQQQQQQPHPVKVSGPNRNRGGGGNTNQHNWNSSHNNFRPKNTDRRAAYHQTEENYANSVQNQSTM